MYQPVWKQSNFVKGDYITSVPGMGNVSHATVQQWSIPATSITPQTPTTPCINSQPNLANGIKVML